jgi:hypothetical protein
VQENDGDSAFRSRLDYVQADAVGVDITVFKFHSGSASKNEAGLYQRMEAVLKFSVSV